MYLCIYIYIYTYTERERVREKEISLDAGAWRPGDPLPHNVDDLSVSSYLSIDT